MTTHLLGSKVRARHIRLGVAAVALVGGAALAGAVGAASASAATTSVNPKVVTILGAAKKSILARSSVRINSTGHSVKTHKLTETTTSEEARTVGEQRIVSGAVTVAIRFTPKAAYFSGNKEGLTTVFGMPKDDLTKVGSKWVSIPKSNSAYSDFSSAEIGNLPKEILPTTKAVEKKIKLTTGKSQGVRVDILSWSETEDKTAADFSLALSIKDNSLPISETQVSGGTTELTIFSHWNAKVTVAAPKDTISYTSLSSS